MVGELNYMKTLQDLTKLDDIQKLSNFNLKVMEKITTKRGDRGYQVDNKSTYYKGLVLEASLGVPQLLCETSDF